MLVKGFSVDSSSYSFIEKENMDYEYKHKFLVNGSEDLENDMGMSEKWSEWTHKTAREFSREKDVSIIATKKR